MASGLKIKHESSHVMARTVAAIVFIALCLLVAFYGLRWYNTGETGPFPLPIAAAGPVVDETDVTDEQLTEFKAEAGEPRYISIPVLDVAQSRVIGIGTDKNNALQLPDNIHDAGWYKKSALPGSGTGSVLIVGRSGGPTRPGAFARVTSLQPDDLIIIERGDGVSLNYRVYDVRTMSVEKAMQSGIKEMMYSAEPDTEGLGIVVSSGKWVPKHREYDRRVMIRALLVE